MNSPNETNLVLTRRLADGTIEWIPLEDTNQLAVDPDAAYALIDRSNYEAPESLVAQKQGDNLVLQVGGVETLTLEGFFTVAGATFHPTTDVAGGAGPFSGTPLTAESPVLAETADGTQTLWSAESQAAEAPAVAPTESPGGGGNNYLLWGGAAVAGLGLAAAAGGGGGGGGGGGSTPADSTPPTITSEDSAVALDENSGAGQVVYTATATDAGSITWSLAATGDGAAFSIDRTSGAVTLLQNPDFETKSSYSFTVIATDAAGNRSQQTVSLAINDLDDPPVITSGATAAVDEGSGAGQVIYTATATDEGAVTWALGGRDAGAFSINASTGAVTLTADPDFETQPSYSFTVIATDSASNSVEQAVTLAVNDIDENDPVITSSGTAPDLDENSGAGQVVYTAMATDESSITWTLSGTDAAAFSIDADTGEVTLIDNPDFETQSSYDFTVTATDAAGNDADLDVTLAIVDRDDSAPFITSGALADPIDENSGANQLVYTATATDDSAITWSLSGVDAGDLTIGAANGQVRLTANPDFETESVYTFNVVATDAEGNSSQQAVTLNINDIDENDPVITSGGSAGSIDENSGANQLVYTATATDESAITWSLSGVDAGDFTIGASNGQVRLTANPDFETESVYTFNVVATDAEGNSSQQAVTLTINDLDENDPVITSGGSAGSIDENSGANQLVYTATATDESAITWSLSGADAGDLTIGASNGQVRLTADPDFETESVYTFNVVATDAEGNSSTQPVTLTINDLDDTPPAITSGGSAGSIDENSGANQLVYTATATDDSAITWSLSGVDAGDFTIGASNGQVRLTANPDFETESVYTFNVVATDAEGNSSQQAVTLNINDIDENDPVITSGSSAGSIDENSGANQLVYTATATDESAINWSLSGVDAGDFSIGASNGQVRLTADPDFETESVYTFNVVATDAEGNSSQQAVTLTINDLDENDPVITSGSSAGSIDENSGANQLVYTATATDESAINWSLSGADAGDFTIGASNGQVRADRRPGLRDRIRLYLQRGRHRRRR